MTTLASALLAEARGLFGEPSSASECYVDFEKFFGDDGEDAVIVRLTVVVNDCANTGEKFYCDLHAEDGEQVELSGRLSESSPTKHAADFLELAMDAMSRRLAAKAGQQLNVTAVTPCEK